MSAQRHKGAALGRLSVVKRSTSIPTSERTKTDDENFNKLRLLDISEMAYRPEYVVRWLWYAFGALDDRSQGRLSKMQLKVRRISFISTRNSLKKVFLILLHCRPRLRVYMENLQ